MPPPPCLRIASAAIAAGLWLAAPPAHSTYLTVYGSPANVPYVTTYEWEGSSVSHGSAVGNAAKRSPSGNYFGTRALRWDALGNAVELGNLGTSNGVYTAYGVSDVNNAGSAVGQAEKYDDLGDDKGTRAVLWDAAGTIATELGHLGTDSNGSTYAGAYAINDVGLAVGYAVKFDAQGLPCGDRAVRWDDSGSAFELGNLGTSSNGYTDCRALVVNSAGIAAGRARKYTSAHVA
ncbi:MAG: hypothetical protein IT443_05815 [Phycisphaeraceae bacterium]|nr:hypothetical protein [Phycisphaeraceae bacterium]